MKSILLTLLILMANTIILGCGSPGDLELLESQLRQQERYQAVLKEEISEKDDEIRLIRGEVSQLRQNLSDNGTPAILPEQAAIFTRTEGLKFNALLTGLLPVDERHPENGKRIAAVLTPHDKKGEAIKVPGEIRITLYGLAKPTSSKVASSQKNTQQQITAMKSWNFSLDETLNHWQNDFLSKGYNFHLPWNDTPLQNKLLVAQLKTTDGRIYEAKHLFGKTSKQALVKRTLVKRTLGKRTAAAIETAPPNSTPLMVPLPKDIDTNAIDANTIGERQNFVIPPFLPVPPSEKESDSENSGAPPFPTTPIETSDRWKEIDRPIIR